MKNENTKALLSPRSSTLLNELHNQAESVARRVVGGRERSYAHICGLIARRGRNGETNGQQRRGFTKRLR